LRLEYQGELRSPGRHLAVTAVTTKPFSLDIR
jgi:hypothetical protein